MVGIKTLDRLDKLTGVRAVAAATIAATFIALCAHISFYLPGNPVPVTLQVFGVLCCGMLLGPKLGMLAIMEYLVAGLCGAPVFSAAAVGLKSILGPTGGYLIGFIAAAGVTGYLAKSSSKTTDKQKMLAGVAGVAVIYAFGACWLRCWLSATGLNFNGWSAWAMGVAPFILLDMVKVLMAVAVSRKR